MSLLAHYLGSVRQFVAVKNGAGLGMLFLIHPFVLDDLSRPISQLARDLQKNPEMLVQINENDDGEILKCLVPRYLEFLAGSHAPIEQWITNLAQTFNALYSVFSHDSYSEWIWPLVREFAKQYTNLAMLAEKSANDNYQNITNEAARMLFRLFTLALSEKQPDFTGKKKCLLLLANCLFKLYFRTNQVRLCATIHTNTSNLRNLTSFCKSDRIAYKYYIGRYYLQQYQIHEAFECLESAFRLCHKRDSNHRRKILIYLIPCALIIGILPSKELLLDTYNLTDAYWPVITALIHGDFKSFRHALCAPNRIKWFIRNGTYLLLIDRCQILMYRNLFRRTFLATYIPEQRTTFVEGKKLLQAYQWICKRNNLPVDGLDELDLTDIECICVNLLDQGYLKGYIMHSGMYLVLKKDEQFGFQTIRDVRPAVMSE